MFQLFAAYRHAYLVAMFKPYLTAQSVLMPLPGKPFSAHVEGIANISGC